MIGDTLPLEEEPAVVASSGALGMLRSPPCRRWLRVVPFPMATSPFPA